MNSEKKNAILWTSSSIMWSGFADHRISTMISRSSRQCFTEAEVCGATLPLDLGGVLGIGTLTDDFVCANAWAATSKLTTYNLQPITVSQWAAAAPLALVFLQSQMVIHPITRITPSTRQHSLDP